MQTFLCLIQFLFVNLQPQREREELANPSFAKLLQYQRLQGFNKIKTKEFLPVKKDF